MGLFGRLGQFRNTTGAIFVPLAISLLHYRSKMLIVPDCQVVNMGVFGRLGQFRITTGAISVPQVILLLVN